MSEKPQKPQKLKYKRVGNTVTVYGTVDWPVGAQYSSFSLPPIVPKKPKPSRRKKPQRAP